jgi:signal transduction histidine kinase
VRYETGTIVAYEGTVEDITERKALEGFKDGLISIAAHELRGPLTSIHAALNWLTEANTALSPQQHGLLALASKNSGRMARLIDDILDVEQAEAGRMALDVEPLEMMPLVERAIELNRGQGLRSGIRLAVGEALPDARVNAHVDRLLQVMTNLISNAVKFSPAGETVTVSVSRQGTSIRVSVTDRGPGIPEGFQARIFQKFARARNQQHAGSGLGLAISKAIIEGLGGSIGFEAASGQGTTFFFDLKELSE